MTEFYRFIKSKGYRMRHSLFFPVHILIPLAGIFLYLAYMGLRQAGVWGAFDNVCDTSGNGLPCYSRNRNGNAHGSGGKSGKNAEPAGSTRPHKSPGGGTDAFISAGSSCCGDCDVWFWSCTCFKRGKKEWG